MSLHSEKIMIGVLLAVGMAIVVGGSWVSHGWAGAAGAGIFLGLALIPSLVTLLDSLRARRLQSGRDEQAEAQEARRRIPPTAPGSAGAAIPRAARGPSATAHHGDPASQPRAAQGLNSAQPPPSRSEHPAVWDLVLADIAERDQVGEQKYGVRLQPHNGRDPLVDAYQEALDLVVYLRQTIYERDGK